MELKQLRYFVRVAELGSYTRAAEQLGVAQPILSRQIRQLETELRCNLLNRHGRGVTLTERGVQLLNHARHIEQSVVRINEDLSSDFTSPSGHLAVGMPPTVSRMVSLSMIRTLRKELPNAQFSIHEALTSTLQKHLIEGRLDIALLNSPHSTRGLEMQRISNDLLYLIARQDDTDPRLQNPITADVLAELPLVTPNSQNTFRRLIEQELTPYGQKPNIVLEVDSVGLILDLVYEKIGYAVLSKHVLPLSRHESELRLVPIVEPELHRYLFLAVSDKHSLSRLQERAFAVIRQVCLEYFG